MQSVCERYLCILWFTALLCLNGLWLLRQVNMAGSGSILYVRCVEVMCPMETTVTGEGIGIGPNSRHPPPNHLGVYLDVILWTLQVEEAHTSETTMSQPKEL
jgi:hypothetical protein